jgi:hypothetical protein
MDHPRGITVADLFDTLRQLLLLILKLGSEVGTLLLHWWVVLLWIAWWLWGVNWQKAWPVLSRGAWIPFGLVVVLAALAWSQIMPSTRTVLGTITLLNFWWQLTACAALAATALFCGWLQGVMHWTPAEVDVEPPAHVEHGHGHH